VPALACALAAGLLAGALAGPPPAGSAATPRVVANNVPAPEAAPILPAGDPGALQAPAPPPPPPPPPVAPSASNSPATEPSSAAGETTSTSDNTASTNSGDGADAKPAPAKKPAAKPTTASKPEPPPVKHVFVVMLADKSFSEAFGPASPAPYLAHDLRGKGALLRRYFATAHGSLPNYIALLGGQAANPDSAPGCAALTPFVAAGKPAADGEVRGKGCVFDASVPSLPVQLERKKLAWRVYVGGAAPPPVVPPAAATPPAAAPAAPCQPPPAAADGTPAPVDRDPFLFFAAIAAAPDCTARVTGFATLATDLAAPLDAAPAFTLIVPDTCSAGRDGACPLGEPAGLARSDAWLREWIPRITASPAYGEDGMVVITFDQARVSGPEADSTSCCDQALGLNEPESIDPQAPAPGGGRVGALVLSPRVKAGTVSNAPYNHFALLRTIEDAFDLDHLGLAGDDKLKPFGDDVFAGG
jgi:hypothetical protein